MNGRRLWLIRHPPVAVAAGVCYGSSDVALAAPAGAAHRPTGLPADIRTVSSPLRRCADLAGTLSRHVVLDARLTEIDFGAWELQRFDDLPRADIDRWAASPWTFRPPGGESAADMARRTLAAWQDHGETGQDDLAIVAHGGPLRVIAGHLTRLPRARWLDLAIPQGGWLMLEQVDGDWIQA